MSFFSTLLALGLAMAANVPPAPLPAASAEVSVAPALPALPQTMTLVLQGNVVETAAPIDFSLAVAEPDFSADLSLANSSNKNNPLRLSFSGTVQLKDGRYLVSYTLKWQRPVNSTEVTKGMAFGTVRTFSLVCSTYLRVGVPVAIEGDGGKKLTLTIRPVEKTDPNSESPH